MNLNIQEVPRELSRSVGPKHDLEEVVYVAPQIRVTTQSLVKERKSV